MYKRISFVDLRNIIKEKGFIEVTMSAPNGDPNKDTMKQTATIVCDLKSIEEIEPAVKAYQDFCGRNERPWYYIWELPSIIE